MPDKLPKYKTLHLPKLLKEAKQLPQSGYLKMVAKDHYSYLNIDDNYVHQLYPFLQDEDKEIQKPRYFGDGLVGAHISVIYPDEKKVLKPEDINKEHAFEITNVMTMDIDAKRYFVLGINSPSLVAVRGKYKLPELLSFRTYSVQMHITIGVSMLM